ncbi:ABC transporter ATP-binding protein [Butyrivibrio sp. WCE2006]|uniref:ABC transporter ATP-binding protein n=1 Tax=Butyrivibrio sp. WCE2006 TaxID=1410611 RepID=UPI0005D28688|nr:ABC transporter ATP-binding protein [Butyrivibrio sp. WCE2006]
MKIVLDNLTKKFPSRNRKIKEETIAVKNFTYEIPDGKLVGLLGPSGCGKSTVLNLISGLEKPTAGKIYFGDEDVTELPPENRGVGLVFQNYALYPHLNVEDNIKFPLENLRGKNKLSKEEMDRRVLEVAKLVQIENLLDRKPSEMSGGQQQRVAIARALVKRPKVLLLDEPLSNLDARLRLQTREELKRIQLETGITTIFVTHDQEEAMSICDVMLVMKNGEIMQHGAPQEVYDHPDNLFVAKFLGTPQINVFHGKLKDGGIYIGKDRVMEEKMLYDESDALASASSSGRENTEGNDNNSVGTVKKDNIENYSRSGNVIEENASVRNNGTERNVYIAVRPEGFEMVTEKGIDAESKRRNDGELEKGSQKAADFLDNKDVSLGDVVSDSDKNVLHCDFVKMEVMGRDTSIISKNADFDGNIIRAIIPSERRPQILSGEVAFRLKPSKVHVFDEATQINLRISK